MNKLKIGLLGAAALATTVLLVRQQKVVVEKDSRTVPAGEDQPHHLTLERIREIGL